MSHEEILAKLLSDKPFYDVSGGGVTLTGGEATLCMEWVGQLAKELSENGVNVLLETCGMFDYGKAKEHLLPYLKDIYIDIKIFDRADHMKYCGAPNDVILGNFERLLKDKERFGYDILPRTPLVPGITDTEENLTKIADFYVSLGVKKTELLPYNPTWYNKNDKLGIKLADELSGLTSWQSKEKVAAAKEIFTSRGIECR